MIGRQISRYRIIEKLGAGGMGIVYKAQDTELGRYVALKFLPSEVAANPQSLGRFVREARAAAALNHPHICTIYEVNGNPPEPFIAMEYLDGQTLRGRIAAQPLASQALLDFAIQLADAVSAAHERNIVHRDLKPANIFITKSDQVKILDFGLAKLVPKEGGDEVTHGDANDQMTGAGTTVGTVSYMSPEQARGEDVDNRSDIFSLGAVLYEMATGRLAFEGNTPAVIFNAILSLSPIPPKSLNPDLSPDLARIIARCLEKNRELRYQNAADLRADLRRLKRDSDSAFIPSVTATAVSVGVPVRRWKPLAAIGAAGLIIAAAVALLIPRFRASGDVMKETDVILLTDFVNTTGNSMFDGALKQALALKLEESPFLNVFPEQQIRETLGFMRRSPDEKLSAEIGREVCQRQNLKAMMNGEIAQLGSQFVITLNAIDCSTGNVLARDQVQAARQEDVLKSVGEAGLHMRQKLGESLPMIQKMNAPIDQATTSSLEALKTFSAAEAQRARGAETEAATLYQHAIDLDPSFTLAYARLGVLRNNSGDAEEAKKQISKAYEMRDRVSERERLYVTAHYQHIFEKDNDKATATYKLWRQTYPHDYIPAVNLGNIYMQTSRLKEAAEQLEDSLKLFPSPIAYGNLASTYSSLGDTDKVVATNKAWMEKIPTDGSPHNSMANYDLAVGQYEDALAAAKKAVELEPIPLHYASLVRSYLFLNRFDEARGTADKAVAEKKDNPDLHFYLSAIAWRRGDEAVLNREAEWRKGKPFEAVFIGFDGAIAASEGRLREAEPLLRRSVDLGAKANLSDGVARFATVLGPIYTAYGLQSRATETIRVAMKGVHNRTNLIDSGIVMAETGDDAGLAAVIGELSTKSSGDLLTQRVVIPSIKAAAELHRNKPEEALNLLKDTAPYADIGVDYLRGIAEAKAGRHKEAIAELLKLTGQPGVGLVSNFVIFNMAHLALARSYVAVGDTAKARQAYETFFTFWKRPDPDIPVLRDARSEYGKIR